MELWYYGKYFQGSILILAILNGLAVDLAAAAVANHDRFGAFSRAKGFSSKAAHICTLQWSPKVRNARGELCSNATEFY